MQAGLSVYSASREESRIEHQVSAEAAAVTRAEAAAKSEEVAVAGFQEAVQQKMAVSCLVEGERNGIKEEVAVAGFLEAVEQKTTRGECRCRAGLGDLQELRLTQPIQ